MTLERLEAHQASETTFIQVSDTGDYLMDYPSKSGRFYLHFPRVSVVFNCQVTQFRKLTTNVHGLLRGHRPI